MIKVKLLNCSGVGGISGRSRHFFSACPLVSARFGVNFFLLKFGGSFSSAIDFRVSRWELTTRAASAFGGRGQSYPAEVPKVPELPDTNETRSDADQSQYFAVAVLYSRSTYPVLFSLNFNFTFWLWRPLNLLFLLSKHPFWIYFLSSFACFMIWEPNYIISSYYSPYFSAFGCIFDSANWAAKKSIFIIDTCINIYNAM